MTKKELRRIEEQLKAATQCLKAKEEECRDFEVVIDLSDLLIKNGYLDSL